MLRLLAVSCSIGFLFSASVLTAEELKVNESSLSPSDSKVVAGPEENTSVETESEVAAQQLPATAEAGEPSKATSSAAPVSGPKQENATSNAVLASPSASSDQKATDPSPKPQFDFSFLKKWSIGGYGEALVSTKFYGPDPSEEYDPSDYRQTEVDLARVVFFVGYEFANWLSFESEIEFEHGGTGATMEVEWDEFGEYEVEIEKGGEIVLEQAYLDARIGPYFSAKLGHLLVPVGMISEYHTPILFSSTHRAESESHLIPSTWHETGGELGFQWKGLAARALAVTGLDSTGFSSSNWVAGGTQRRFEAVISNDWGAVLRLDYSGIRGLMFGVSGYTSNTTRNRPKRDMYDDKARVFIGDVHARYHYGPFRAAALGMFGKLTNADLITEKNSSLSQYLEVPRTPVGSAAYAYNVELALDTIGLFAPDSKHRLDVFICNDGYDTMWKAPDPDSEFDNPLLQRQVLTVGLNYFPHPRVVLKGEYLSRWINRDNDWGRHQHEMNFALGFVL